MKLSAARREMLVTFAKEAALRHYLRRHPTATEETAWRFALRAWRLPEFIQVAADIIAICIVIDEDAAAPFN